jgi:FkbM family methyltransferase
MRKLLTHLWHEVNRLVDDVSNYVFCFGYARGLLLLISKIIRPGSGQTSVLASVPDSRFKLLVRPGTSDLAVFSDIYYRKEDEWPFAKEPRVIIDAGAYTGLSTAYFAIRYPEARVIAVEPSKENFSLLVQNVSPFKNIQIINAALWSESGSVELKDPGRGAWGFTVGESGNRSANGDDAGSEESGDSTVPALTVSDIMRKCRLDKIDLLKLDIEGSEIEVLSASGPWIEHVEAISVELHDRFKPGCTRAFFGAVSNFPTELRRGEKILVVRDGSPMIRLHTDDRAI